MSVRMYVTKYVDMKILCAISIDNGQSALTIMPLTRGELDVILKMPTTAAADDILILTCIFQRK